MDKYIINPKTGRKIKVGGRVYNTLLNSPDAAKVKRAKRMTSNAASTAVNLKRTLVHLPKTRVQRRKSLSAQIKKTSEGRGSRTRGWAAAAPQRGKERQKLMTVCGRKCFLDPDALKYPVCPALRASTRKQKCNVDCRGVITAKIRSSQHKHAKVAKRAATLAAKRCPTK